MAGESKDVEYVYANNGPAWSYLATNINISLLGIIADSLLVRMLILYLFLSLNIFADMEMLQRLE